MNELKRELWVLLQREEGVVYNIYLDHLGYPTFGVGHLITREDEEYGQPVGTPVSEERVMAVFREDLQEKIDATAGLLGDDWWNLPAVCQKILVSMVFQMGRRGVGNFRNFLAAVRVHDWPTAADEMLDSRWARQTPARANRHSNEIRALAA